jgi:hypothetical protein
MGLFHRREWGGRFDGPAIRLANHACQSTEPPSDPVGSAGAAACQHLGNRYRSMRPTPTPLTAGPGWPRHLFVLLTDDDNPPKSLQKWRQSHREKKRNPYLSTVNIPCQIQTTEAQRGYQECPLTHSVPSENFRRHPRQPSISSQVSLQAATCRGVS